MISRRSRCAPSWSANRSRSGAGKYSASVDRRDGSSGRSEASTCWPAAILVCASSTASSGRGQAGARRPPRRDLLVVRQPVASPATPGSPGRAGAGTWRARGAAAAPGSGRRPAPCSARRCAAARARRPRRSARAAACRAPRPELAAAIAPASRILMLTSWSEVSTPAELSMKSVFTRPPPSAYSIRAAWVSPRLPPSRDHPRPQLGRVDPHRVAGPVARVGVRLVRRLHVGADAAVPQQVDRRAQDRGDQLVGRERGDRVVEAERRAGLRGDRHRLRRTAARRRRPAEISAGS